MLALNATQNWRLVCVPEWGTALHNLKLEHCCNLTADSSPRSLGRDLVKFNSMVRVFGKRCCYLAIGISNSSSGIGPDGKSSNRNLHLAPPVASMGVRTEQVKFAPQQNPSNTTVSDSDSMLPNEISIFGLSVLSNAYVERSRSPSTDV